MALSDWAVWLPRFAFAIFTWLLGRIVWDFYLKNRIANGIAHSSKWYARRRIKAITKELEEIEWYRDHQPDFALSHALQQCFVALLAVMLMFGAFQINNDMDAKTTIGSALDKVFHVPQQGSNTRRNIDTIIGSAMLLSGLMVGFFGSRRVSEALRVTALVSRERLQLRREYLGSKRDELVRLYGLQCPASDSEDAAALDSSAESG